MSDEFNTNGRQFHDGMVACSSYCILHHIISYHLSYDSTLAHTSLLQHIRDLILFCRRLCGFDGWRDDNFYHISIGSDPKWTAIHKDDYTNFALHYYNSSLVNTNDGYLNITTIVQDVTFKYEDAKVIVI